MHATEMHHEAYGEVWLRSQEVTAARQIASFAILQNCMKVFDFVYALLLLLKYRLFAQYILWNFTVSRQRPLRGPEIVRQRSNIFI